MDLKEIGFNTGYGLLENPCECSAEPLGSISHGVRLAQDDDR